MLKVEPYELHSIVAGTYRLDGGAMFGVVPKVLWQDLTDVDDDNRILLATRTLLAVNRAQRQVILVDTGCGTKWTPEKADRFAIKNDPEAISRVLASIGLSTADVTDVIIGHLHFDHNGGLTEWVDAPDGPTRLCYPQARHWVHRGQWDHACEPSAKDRASYLKDDFAVLAEAKGVLRLVDGDNPAPPFEGVEWFVSHGHTPGQLHPVFGVGDQKLLFLGDLAPTTAHLRPAWVMAYDVEPLVTIREREAVYRRCLDEGLLLAFPHDPVVGGVAITGAVDRPVVSRELSL